MAMNCNRKALDLVAERSIDAASHKRTLISNYHLSEAPLIDVDHVVVIFLAFLVPKYTIFAILKIKCKLAEFDRKAVYSDQDTFRILKSSF